jgi:group I intron endonuclease
MIGIYKITSPTSRVYIGQSNNIERRFKSYYQMYGCLKQIRLYRSFNKYGVKNHKFEILEECSFEELNNRERYYQDKYNVLGKNGLNCILTDSNLKKKVLSEKTKLKIKNSMTGKIKNKETKDKIVNSSKNRIFKKLKYNTIKHEIKTIYQYDLNKNIIKEWKSFQDIVIKYPEGLRTIWKCLRNQQKTSLNYIWTYNKL